MAAPSFARSRGKARARRQLSRRQRCRAADPRRRHIGARDVDGASSWFERQQSRQTGRTRMRSMLTPPIASRLWPIWASIKCWPIASTSAAGTLAPNDPARLATSPGAGPRHIAFHPNGKWAYVINELDSTVTALRYDSEAACSRRSTLFRRFPPARSRENITGEIVVHPNGKFLYGSNRGHDSIAVFAIDQTTGRLDFARPLPGWRTHSPQFQHRPFRQVPSVGQPGLG